MTVLVLAGVELIFYKFGIGFFSDCAGNGLLTQGCFPCCSAGLTQRQSLSCSSPLPSNEEPGGAHGAGRGHTGTADPEWPQGYPRLDGIMLSVSTKRDWGVYSDGVCLPKAPTCCEALLSWRIYEWILCLTIGTGEWIPGFAFLPRRFCFCYETVVISNHKFSLFYPSHLLLHPTGG